MHSQTKALCKYLYEWIIFILHLEWPVPVLHEFPASMRKNDQYVLVQDTKNGVKTLQNSSQDICSGFQLSSRI